MTDRKISIAVKHISIIRLFVLICNILFIIRTSGAKRKLVM